MNISTESKFVAALVLLLVGATTFLIIQVNSASASVADTIKQQYGLTVSSDDERSVPRRANEWSGKALLFTDAHNQQKLCTVTIGDNVNNVTVNCVPLAPQPKEGK